jgi:hypothetical protein
MTRRRIGEFLRRYRFLLIVYLPALLLAGWEITGRIYEDGQAPDSETKKLNDTYRLGYEQFHEEVYPERPRSEFYLGTQAIAKAKESLDSAERAEALARQDPENSKQHAEPARQYRERIHEYHLEARRHFEAALATGVKSDQQLLEAYAKTLILLKEDPEKIDAAVRDLLVNFPRSADPRAGERTTSHRSK